ncbi:histidinol-phosphate transaminase [Paenibacillus cremeus]|uniref:Histidinol-phosphate aminotransferase n=1 Tax=Paenibacillus cremeus TaxID=2163881 RepID=A0A559K8K4_9BACL|nr:histidinol-phosphate transaminase [Paenibacillus cremeus]TVY08448.1 histidinol-phosphate transaminase [Paenibacillus cremeus]
MSESKSIHPSNKQEQAKGQEPVEARQALKQMKPYSPGKPIWEVQAELGLDRVIKLASNENPLGASPKAVEAVQRFLGEVHRYPDAGAVRLRQALAEQLELSPEQLIVTNGGDELLTLMSEAFLEEGDEIVAPTPTFSEYEFGASLMGAVTVSVPFEEGFRYNIDTLLEAVTERTKFVCICSPNNPTGTYLPRNELLRLLEALPSRVLVVYDAAYSHYATANDYTDGMEFVRSGYPILVVQTFSKIFGLAGIRVGFGAASEAVIRSILQVKEPFNVNALAQVAASGAITDRAHIEASRRVNTEGRQWLYQALDTLGLSYTESMSNFVLVELGSGAQQIYERLMRKGIIVRYGAIWGLPQCVRVTVGTEEENRLFISALSEVLQETRTELKPVQ